MVKQYKKGTQLYLKMKTICSSFKKRISLVFLIYRHISWNLWNREFQARKWGYLSWYCRNESSACYYNEFANFKHFNNTVYNMVADSLQEITLSSPTQCKEKLDRDTHWNGWSFLSFYLSSNKEIIRAVD